MSIWMAMLIGAAIGVVLTTLILSHSRNGRIKAEYERYIAELELASAGFGSSTKAQRQYQPCSAQRQNGGATGTDYAAV